MQRDETAKVERLTTRFDAERTKPSSGNGRVDALARGRIRYLQVLARRVCAEAGLPVPACANDAPAGERNAQDD